MIRRVDQRRCPSFLRLCRASAPADGGDGRCEPAEGIVRFAFVRGRGPHPPRLRSLGRSDATVTTAVSRRRSHVRGDRSGHRMPTVRPRRHRLVWATWIRSDRATLAPGGHRDTAAISRRQGHATWTARSRPGQRLDPHRVEHATTMGTTFRGDEPHIAQRRPRPPPLAHQPAPPVAARFLCRFVRSRLPPTAFADRDLAWRDVVGRQRRREGTSGCPGR
jgi:hypothetical protein